MCTLKKFTWHRYNLKVWCWCRYMCNQGCNAMYQKRRYCVLPRMHCFQWDLLYRWSCGTIVIKHDITYPDAFYVCVSTIGPHNHLYKKIPLEAMHYGIYPISSLMYYCRVRNFCWGLKFALFAGQWSMTNFKPTKNNLFVWNVYLICYHVDCFSDWLQPQISYPIHTSSIKEQFAKINQVKISC